MSQELNFENYPFLKEYTTPVKKAEREIVGRDKEMQQILAAFKRPELCNVMLLAEAGCGKGHPNIELLPTPEGFKRVGDIEIGDFVYDEYGYPVEVVGVYPQGKKRLYNVNFEDDSSVPCNDEHIWSVRNRKAHYEDGSYQNMTLREIMDCGITEKSNDGNDVLNKWYIPGNGAVHRNEVELPLDPYVLGVFLGCFGVYSEKSEVVVAVEDKDIIEEISDRLNSKSQSFSPTTLSYKRLSRWCCHYRFDANNDEARLPLDSISSRYMNASIGQRRLLLQGLMDARGVISCVDGLGIYLSDDDYKFVRQVKELADSLGIRAYITEDSLGDEFLPTYSVHFKVDPIDALRLFYKAKTKLESLSLSEMERLQKFNRNYNDLAITGVEDTGRDVEMTCIYVNSPTHLYQVGRGYIVTHNTALVQGTMLHDKKRLYLEVNLSKMIADLTDNNQMADRLKQLFNEVSSYGKNHGVEIVLFMDEFHQVVQLSAAAVEALKPLLADSGTRGIRVVAATTYEEFRKYISSNQPLVERLQRISLKQPDEELTVKILRGMAKRYGVDTEFYDDSVFKLIYEYTNRYIPANSQPRKSILVLDSMVGWHRFDGRRMDSKLLAEVIEEQESVNVAFSVDAKNIKKELDKHVLSQEFASAAIEQRLQICVADLNNKTKPMSTLLFTGSTGVGKLVADYEPVPVFAEDGSVHFKPHGELQVGDKVFSRKGEPEEVEALFPHDKVPMYRVTLTDGRTLDVGDAHLWAVYTSKTRNKLVHGNANVKPKVMSTKEIYDDGVVRTYDDGRRHLKYYIPMNEAVQWPAQKYKLSPYALGLLIGNGSLTKKVLTFSSADDETVQRLAYTLNASGVYDDPASYSHCFYMPSDMVQGSKTRFQTAEVLSEVPELVGLHSRDRFIPERYMHGSVEQRMELVRGLMDTDGTVSSDDRVRVLYSTFSKRLADNLRELLFSLGISNTVSCYTRIREENGVERELTEYVVRIKMADIDKPSLFKLSTKKQRILDHVRTDKVRTKDFSTVGISDITPLGEQSAQCIYVKDDEHLYQAGQFVVTHNTEMTKQLARILFDDDRNLLRFDKKICVA